MISCSSYSLLDLNFDNSCDIYSFFFITLSHASLDFKFLKSPLSLIRQHVLSPDTAGSWRSWWPARKAFLELGHSCCSRPWLCLFGGSWGAFSCGETSSFGWFSRAVWILASWESSLFCHSRIGGIEQESLSAFACLTGVERRESISAFSIWTSALSTF